MLTGPVAALRLPRYYEGSDSCARHPGAQVSPLVSFILPDVPPPTTRVVRKSLWPPDQRLRCVSGFAIPLQARHHSPPNRVRHPADRQFASGCSPPRFAAAQLPSASGFWLSPARTFTLLNKRLHGRTAERAPSARSELCDGPRNQANPGKSVRRHRPPCRCDAACPDTPLPRASLLRSAQSSDCEPKPGQPFLPSAADWPAGVAPAGRSARIPRSPARPATARSRRSPG